ncbi:MAG: serine hydrolase domain-containing protein [Clostridiales bacterium]|nr:serine hydrolase domain-containing protein [Clostridiales bacterium]
MLRKAHLPRPGRIFFMLTVWLAAAALVQAAILPKAKPADVGLSAERLGRLSRVMQEYVDQGKTAGMVTLVARNGRVALLQAYGKFDLGRAQAMPPDAIFRIASQTKAVTSVAVLMLQEEGRLLLDDPVSKYIPEFASSRVAVQAPGQDVRGYTTVPFKRAITIRGLLTHTAGISYGDGPAKEEYLAAGIYGWFLADKPMPIGEVIRKLAALPFDAQPGEKFVYGYSTDILGHVVERVSGMSLADFFEKRITGPLGMADTHFFLPESKLNRFTSVYGVDEKGEIRLVEDARDSPFVKGPRACTSGGAGLLSTAEDFARFLIMLLQGGELGGVRLLSPKSVELMTADHAGNLYGSQGYGLGFWVTDRLGRNGQPGTAGAFGWGGAYHTIYWVDPREKLVAVLMTQLLPAGSSDLHGKFRALAYQAIVDSFEGR